MAYNAYRNDIINNISVCNQWRNNNGSSWQWRNGGISALSIVSGSGISVAYQRRNGGIWRIIGKEAGIVITANSSVTRSSIVAAAKIWRWHGEIKRKRRYQWRRNENQWRISVIWP